MPNTPPNPHLKTNLRRTMRARRNALSDAQRDEFSARICAHLKTYLLAREEFHNTIAIYQALPREVDLSALLELDFNFVVPRRVGGSWVSADEVDAFGPHPNAAQRAPGPNTGEGANSAQSATISERDSLSRARAGCPLGGVGVGAESVAAPQVLAAQFAPANIDIFLLPALAFDAHGNRLGQGGGWYDRVLARAPHALKIGVAFECQIIENLPHEAHDIMMDGVVTEGGWCKYLHHASSAKNS